MDFSLTDEQQMLVDTARTLVAKECPTTLVRAHIDDPAAADHLWDVLGEWMVLAAGDHTDLALFVAAAGEGLVPGPWYPTMTLFAPMLVAVGSERAEDATSGELRGTVAMAGADGRWVANGDTTKTLVLDADHVDAVAVVHDTGDEAVVVVTDQIPVAHQIVGLDSTRRCFTMDITSVLADESAERHVIDRRTKAIWTRRATLAAAADLLGTARRILDMSVAYAKERHQFGVPIGSFQAIQHKLANMALDVERADAAVAYAAMCCDAAIATPDDTGAAREAARATHVAKAAAGAAGMHAAKQGIQTHGGIGYTWEHDLHLYIRHAMFAETFFGNRGRHLDRIADLLLD